jgi:hypothetical protein
MQILKRGVFKQRLRLMLAVATWTPLAIEAMML